MELALIGPPGSGKSTLANSLSVSYDMGIISSGAIARDILVSDPTWSKEGKLAPETQIRRAVENAITAIETNFVLEGFPRTIAQYIFLRQMDIDPLFIWLDVPQVTCIDRMLGRKREDDTPDAMTERLSTYFTQTIELVQMLFDDYKLIKIDAGDLDVEEVHNTAILRLDKYRG